MKKRPAVRNAEAGYALLFVYMMAAVVAVMLYSELPRVAFEAQRDKEQLLIDRGEQYSRAILLYVRKNNRFPPDFDALTNTAGQRYLRHKYKDPMTGKDEWRIIHVGPGGVFTDSLLYTKKATDKGQTGQQNFITELQPVGGTVADPNAQGVNIGLRRRASDQPGAPGSVPGAETGAIPDGAQSGIPNGTIPNGVPNNPLPNGVVGGAQGQQFQPGGLPNGVPQPGQQATGANGFQLPPGVQFPPGTQPPAGYSQAAQPAAPSPSAANLINQILTTPRAGGLNGLNQPAGVDQFGNPLAQGGVTPGPGGTTPAPVQGQTIGGGIAGVASKLEREGIKTYRDRTAYNEWEFVYDLSQDKSRTGLGTGAPGGAVNGAAATGATGVNGSQTATGAVNNTAPASAAYTPQPVQPGVAPPAPLPSGVLGGVPNAGAGASVPGGIPGNPVAPVQPGFTGTPVTQGDPGSPAFPNPGQPGTPVYPTPGAANNAPGVITPSPPIGGGGIVAGPPVGGGTPH